MPRKPSVWWLEDEQCWKSTAIGPISEKTGRRLGRKNRDIGGPKGRDGAANRAAAELWLAAELRAEAEAVRFEGDPNFDRLAEDYMAWCEARGLADRTVRGYMERLRAFGRFLHHGVAYGDRRAGDFRAADLRRVVRAMQAQGAGATWVRDVSAAARACFAWAAREVEDRTPARILAADPFADVDRVRTEEPPKRYAGARARARWFAYAIARVRSLPPAERLARRFDGLFVAMCRFLEATGCRPDEACRLEWSHIDWDARVATLRGKSTGATGKKRRIPIPSDTLAAIRRIRDLPGRHDTSVFTHERRAGGNPTLAGVPWTGNAFAHKFGDWRGELLAALTEGEAGRFPGLASLTPYQLRRDLGSDILRATGSHAESAEVLGHSPEMNRRHYAHFEETRAVDLAERAAEIRRGGGGAADQR